MSEVNVGVFSNSLVVTFDGENHPIAEQDYRYDAVLQAWKDGELDKIPDLVKVDRLLSDPERGLNFKDNTIYIGDEQIPEDLANRVMEFRTKGLPYEYLMLFAKKLKKNPSYNSRQMLFAFLENNGHPITRDGNFIAYRYVSEDFKDCHTNTFDNSVGAVVEMPREQVDDNPNNTCSRGLHVACHSYASNFRSGGNLVEVEVDPADVVCVPTDYNGTKMRVCKFKVTALCKGNREDEQLYNYDESDPWDPFNGEAFDMNWDSWV